jgi:Restriction endonuclease
VDDWDDPLNDSKSAPLTDASDVDLVVLQIQERNKPRNWVREQSIDLGGRRWRPSAVSESGEHILYVALGNEIPNYVADRLRAATGAGFQVVVAIPLAALYTPSTLEVLADVDADVYVFGDPRTESLQSMHFMAAIAELGVPVESNLRRSIGVAVLARLDTGTAHQKGRRMEALLAFLFAQVGDLRVVERNYDTETQEIDLVLQVDNISNRVWRHLMPFILVEAKNTAEPAGQPIVSLMIHKVRTKRGTCKIGVIVSRNGFTSDARAEEMRISESENCVVLLDGNHLAELVAAADLDDALETFVRRAMLR